MDTYTSLAWLIPLFPLVSFVLTLTLGRSFRKAGILIGSAGSLAALVLSLLILIERSGGGAEDYNSSFQWIQIGEFTLSMGFEVTNLTALMLAVVTLVSFLVNVYSAGYMREDERITVYYSYIALFSFSMLGLVLADNLLSLYVFWELVGVSSFLLIGFWYAKPGARAAAKKAFIVTRIGDAGLLIAILLLFWYMPDHALDFVSLHNVFEGAAGSIASEITTLIALLIFLGAVGKSGQFPLHVWLPDAMEGPTPISALIHAATMVAAGVYLVARTFDIFQASEAAMGTVAYFGGFTAIFAATIALTQNDLKRILAYSTVSQLGYMMMALGLGSLTGGIFHLFTHAFFKALLFLAAGSVIHAVHTQNIQEMGGLGTRMRITAWTFAIGALALSGIPPFSGFWSKDVILSAALDHNPLLFGVGLLTAFCTALYMTRLYFLVFLGKPGKPGPGKPQGEGQHSGQGRSSHTGVKESPPVMTVPLLVLAFLSLTSGFLETPWNPMLGSWLSGEAEEAHASGLVIIASIAVSVLGIYIGWLLYGKGSIRRDLVSSSAPWLVKLPQRKYYIDEVYEVLIVAPLRGIGHALTAFDRYVVDGVVRGIQSMTSTFGMNTARVQNGQVQTYGLAAALGLVIMIIAIVGRRFW
ncbi:NADH-quinone oxidoreductase subunit L [Paenibacillus sp. GCM10023252]|uniref:NADH-quinone oxidoreductase subunit L n=1 Tax=Paenibacillus sp. GCM10023252 TaxID=3252649 RepID=UPI00362008CD